MDLADPAQRVAKARRGATAARAARPARAIRVVRAVPAARATGAPRLGRAARAAMPDRTALRIDRITAHPAAVRHVRRVRFVLVRVPASRTGYGEASGSAQTPIERPDRHPGRRIATRPSVSGLVGVPRPGPDATTPATTAARVGTPALGARPVRARTTVHVRTTARAVRRTVADPVASSTHRRARIARPVAVRAARTGPGTRVRGARNGHGSDRRDRGPVARDPVDPRRTWRTGRRVRGPIDRPDRRTRHRLVRRSPRSTSSTTTRS